MFSSKTSGRGADFLAALAIIVIVAAMYLPTVLSGRTLLDNPALNDVSTNFYPDIYWMGDAWRSGEFPLWNPHTTCGAPLLGYTHCGGWYPVEIVLYSMLSYVRAGSFGIIFHTMVAALLMFWALRQLETPTFLSLAGGLTYVFSGTFFGTIYMTPMAGSISGFLALWISLRALMKKPSLWFLLAAAASLAWSLVPGDPETFAYGVMTVALALFLERISTPRHWPRLAVLFSIAVVLGVLLGLGLFLPALENAHYSIRGPLMPFPIDIESLPPQWPLIVPTWAFPFKYFSAKLGVLYSYNHGLSYVFQGALVPLLFAASLTEARRDRTIRFLALTWGILLLFIILSESPATRDLVRRLPLVGDLRVPTKAVYYLNLLGLMLIFRFLTLVSREGTGWHRHLPSLVMAVGGLGMVIAQPWCLGGPERYLLGAAAIGLGAAFEAAPSRLSGKRMAWLCAGFMALEVIIMAARTHPRTDPRLYSLPPSLEKLKLDLRDGTRYAVFEQLLPLTVNDPPPLFGRFEVETGGMNFSGPSRALPAWIFLYQTLFLDQLLIPGPGGVNYFNHQSQTNPGTLRRDRMHLFNLAGIKLILSRDLAVPFTSPYSFLKTGSLAMSSRSGMVEEGPEGGLTLRGPSRLAAPVAALPGDRLMIGGEASDEGRLISTGLGADSARLLRAKHFAPGRSLDWSLGLDSFPDGEQLGLSWLPRDPASGTVNLHRLEIVNPDRPFQRWFQSGGIELFTNRDALPRAFLVRRTEVEPSLSRTMELIQDPRRFRPLEWAALAAPLASTNLTLPAGKGREQVVITSYGPHRIEMTVTASSPAVLVFTDTYFPGWKARIDPGDGWRETRIARADLAFRAIRIEGGITRVRWTYEPVSFRVGLWAGLAALLCLTVTALARTSRRFLAGRSK